MAFQHHNISNGVNVLITPTPSRLGKVYCGAPVCLYVCVCLSVWLLTRYLKSIQPINFSFGGSLSSDPEMK